MVYGVESILPVSDTAAALGRRHRGLPEAYYQR